ncbi:transposase [Porticoccus sp. GXU_MW_L64]
MPRRARISLAGVPHHIIQRGNNRAACFYSEDDYLFYLDWLKEYSEISQCQVHAYVLMTNHVHLLLTPKTESGVGLLMRRLGQRYVQYINRTYRRSGTLWEGRFKSCITQEEDYVLGCYRYIELNPVRASMVSHPAEYRWSSYRVNAQGEASELIAPQEMYCRLGGEAENRQRHYRELFRYHLDPGLVDDIRQATNGNYALGSDRFKQEIESAIGRRVTRGRSGRPRKKR